jgi:hypothetical protein
MFRTNVDYVVADKLLQSDLGIKNSSEANELLNLQLTFKTPIESWSTF